MKIREFIKQDIDIDVYDNVCDGIGIAYCGPMALTEEGEKQFADVLDYDIEVKTDSTGYEVAIVDTNHEDWKERFKKAKDFFYSIAGFVDADLFDKWFIFID